MGVPTFYSRLLGDESLGLEDCAGVRVFISGSAPLTEAVSDLWAARTGHRILERYGMTEAGIITTNPLEGERIAGTVGFALSDYELRVCDEAGEELTRGEVGTLEVRGSCLFTGYWRRPGKTAEEVRQNGFFITGDLAIMDDHDRVSIVGRAKDLIICGGYNIYPKEIETVLDSVDGIAESAVVGVPHPEMGEGVAAILVATKTRPDQAQIQARLDAELARFKHPRRFFWLDELPRNAMGKVQKKGLSEEYRDAYAD
jgi:malonyl-CoA/methylmalonyl-CoA synthetase